MNNKILLMIAIVSTISLHGMDGDHTDKQLTTTMAALEINKDTVDAWDALGKTKKKEVRSILEKWAKKYNEHYSKEDPEIVLNEEKLKKAVKQAYNDIKSRVRNDDEKLPTLPSDEAEREKAEKAYYYEGFLRGAIQMIRCPGAVCSFNLEPEVISDSEDEDTDKK